MGMVQIGFRFCWFGWDIRCVGGVHGYVDDFALLCCVDVVFHCVDDFALLCLCCSYAVVLMILLCCVCQIFLLNKCLHVVLEKKEWKRFINKVTDTTVL